MKLTYAVLISLAYITFASSKARAQNVTNRTVIIEEATCTYDNDGFPIISVRIYPPIEVQKVSIDTFHARSLEMCPRMEEISGRIYIPVTFRTEDYYFYKHDSNHTCNYYKGTSLYMTIPTPTNDSRYGLSVEAELSDHLVESNVNPYNCSFGGH